MVSAAHVQMSQSTVVASQAVRNEEVVHHQASWGARGHATRSMLDYTVTRVVCKVGGLVFFEMDCPKPEGEVVKVSECLRLLTCEP